MPTAIATLLVYAIVRSAGVSFVAYSNYLVPVYALGLGAAILGETLTANVGIGLVLILAGIAASRMRRAKPLSIPHAELAAQRPSKHPSR